MPPPWNWTDEDRQKEPWGTLSEEYMTHCCRCIAMRFGMYGLSGFEHVKDYLKEKFKNPMPIELEEPSLKKMDAVPSCTEFELLDRLAYVADQDVVPKSARKAASG